MARIKVSAASLLLDQEGQSVAEYALLLAVVAIPFVLWSEKRKGVLLKMCDRMILELIYYVNVF